MQSTPETEFNLEMRELILNAQLDHYGEKYWTAVVQGLKLLYKYKRKIEQEQFKRLYEALRVEITSMGLDDIIEDLADEISAILIRWYPMPDFWIEDIEAFKKHKGFKEYFEKGDE